MDPWGTLASQSNLMGEFQAGKTVRNPVSVQMRIAPEQYLRLTSGLHLTHPCVHMHLNPYEHLHTNKHVSAHIYTHEI